MSAVQASWQPSLFGDGEARPDPSFASLRHHRLDETAWLDHAPGWLGGADSLFEDLAATAPWQTSTQELYGRVVVTPRLIARWPYTPGDADLPSVLEAMRALMESRYERPFDSVSANLYRDGRDSVAWHADRIPRTIFNPVVATVSLGHARRFLMRPRGGTTQLTLTLGAGDLVVMGGTSQRTWQHAIPKVASAGARISVAFRHSR
jgi:alkylated DNA repair dioxygenase AlkB